MPSYEDLVKGLTIISCGVGSGAAIRLYYQSLHKRFFLLFSFLCFHVVRSLFLLTTPWWFARPRNAYGWAWVYPEPMLWIFYILVSLDVYSLVLHKYKGLQTVGRWVFIIAITLAVGISAASLIPTGRSAAESAP